MNRTASSIRVALQHAYLQDRQVRRAFFHRVGMNNLLSVEVPLDAQPSDWRMFDDPHGRDYDDTVADMGNVDRTIGLGQLQKAVKSRGKITFFVKYKDGLDEEKALYDLEKNLSKQLRDMAKDDDGIAALLYGLNSTGGRFPNLDPESEAWAG
jgi:hypothetical protein